MKKRITAAFLTLLFAALSVNNVFAEERKTLELEENYRISLNAFFESEGLHGFTSENTDSVTVSENGMLFAAAPGVSNVYAYDKDGDKVSVKVSVSGRPDETRQSRICFTDESGGLFIDENGRAQWGSEPDGFYLIKGEEEDYLLYSVRTQSFLSYDEKTALFCTSEEKAAGKFQIIITPENKSVILTEDGAYALTHVIDSVVMLQPSSFTDWQSFDIAEDTSFVPGWPSSDTFTVTGLDYYFSNGKKHNNGKAVDIGDGAKGHTVTAIEDGTVIRCENNCSHVNNTHCACNGGSGNYISIMHKNGYVSKYLHLEKDGLKVKPGDTVKKGQVIAAMGSSGRSSGYHVHLALLDAGGQYLYVFDYLTEDEELMKKVRFTGRGPVNGRYYNYISKRQG